MAHALDRITHDPSILAGRAAIRGRRISVAHIDDLVDLAGNALHLAALVDAGSLQWSLIANGTLRTAASAARCRRHTKPRSLRSE